MRLVFIGTDTLGATALEKILQSTHEVALVITQPDRPSGRGRKTVPGDVKKLAESQNIDILQPEKIKNPDVLTTLQNISPDLIVVVSYGEYIPRSIYELPRYRSINLHPSLLPRWRGASPVQYTLLNGDEIAGVTVQYVHKKLDAGAILMREQIPVEPDDDHGSLCDKLYPLGASMLVKVIDRLEAGTISAVEQDESRVTSAPKIRRSDYWVNWSEPADKCRNRIRAFSPIPGARTIFRGRNFKLLEASVIETTGNNECPGIIESVDGDGPVVACGVKSLKLTRVQPAGKNPQSGKDFLNGYQPSAGEKFTSGDTEQATI